MTPIDTSDLGWYRLLLKLYPKAYRQEYADEMLATLQEMFAAAPSARDKRQLVVRIIKDYVLSLSRQNLYATTSSFNAAPYPIKRDTAISASLVAPFFIIFTYNTLSLIVRHTVTLHVHNIEAHTWVIYSIMLPLLALILSIKVCLSSVYTQLLQRKWRQAARAIFSDWLFLGITVAVLAVVAIF